MPPFWVLRRADDEAKANMKIVRILVDANVAVKVGEAPMGWQEANLLSYDHITVPVAVNTESVLKDEELLVYFPPPQKRVAQKAKSKAKSWHAEAARFAKKQRV
eukprot:10863647-Alexandrium_andersonii.AAC.1